MTKTDFKDTQGRLLKILTEDGAVLLLRAESPEAAAWISPARIESGLRGALVETVPVCAAPLDSALWLIEVRLPVSREDSALAAQMCALADALTEALNREQGTGNKEQG